MANAYGGFQVSGGSTAQTLAGAAKLLHWETFAVSSHGDTSVTPTLANDDITLKPGKYKVDVSVNVTTTTGQVFTVRKGSTAQDGLRCDFNAASTKVQCVISGILEVTESDYDGGTNNVISLYGETAGDVTLLHGQFMVTRLD